MTYEKTWDTRDPRRPSSEFEALSRTFAVRAAVRRCLLRSIRALLINGLAGRGRGCKRQEDIDAAAAIAAPPSKRQRWARE
jgi:hypothetical protein